MLVWMVKSSMPHSSQKWKAGSSKWSQRGKVVRVLRWWRNNCISQLLLLVADKRGPTLTHKLFSFFANCSNPFLYSLKLYANCSSNLSKTNSLAYASKSATTQSTCSVLQFVSFFFDLFVAWISVLEDLHNFKRTNDIRPDPYIDDNLRMVAFNFIKKQSQPNLYKIVVVTFDLLTSRHLFIDKIRDLIREHHYKEVCGRICRQIVDGFHWFCFFFRHVNCPTNWNCFTNFRCTN